MKSRTLLAGILLITTMFTLAADETAELSEQEQYEQWAMSIWESLDKQSGSIELAQAGATLNVPDTFYYLSPQDTERVLVEVWGNPPGQVTLGMLFPEGMTPFDPGSWGVSIEYEEDGYVSDADADDIDYTELLQQMKEDTRSSSEARIREGYEGVELIGWAAHPYYDTAEKKLHWAKEIKFGDQDINTLNYSIRVLGRKGVLVLNFIADMDQLELINSNIGTVLALAEFGDGSRYGDFDPDVDKVAAYGLGALVAGKVAAKTGLIAAALVFLKKFGVIIVVAIGALGKKLFSRKKEA